MGHHAKEVVVAVAVVTEFPKKGKMVRSRLQGVVVDMGLLNLAEAEAEVGQHMKQATVGALVVDNNFLALVVVGVVVVAEEEM